MSPELAAILVVVVNIVWDIVRKKFSILNPTPAPAPHPDQSPIDLSAIVKILWDLLRSKFPALPPLAQGQAFSAEHLAAVTKAANGA